MKMQKALLGLLVLIMLTMNTSAEETAYHLDINGRCTISEDLYAEKIEDGVFQIIHEFPWCANSLVIEIKNSDIVLIDTPYTYEATKELVEWIFSLAGNSVNITAINTGFHFDNLGGNKYLLEQGFKVYGTSKTVALIRERGETSRTWFLNSLQGLKFKKYHDVFAELEYTEPSEIVDLGLDEEIALDFGTESILLYYPGESHSPDNIVAFYPDKGVLFGGCMVKEASAVNLGNIDDANLQQWPVSINRLKLKYSAESVNTVVPGHGKSGDILLLDKTLALLK